MPLPFIAIGMIAAAAGKLVGGILSSVDQKEQAEAEAREEERRARISMDLAKDAYMRGKFSAGIVTLKTNRAMQSVYSQAAANGLDSTIGAPVAMAAGEQIAGYLDRDLIMANAAREAWGKQEEARQHRENAKKIRKAGSKQEVGNILGIAADAVGSAASIGGTLSPGGMPGPGGAAVSGLTAKPGGIDWVKQSAYINQMRQHESDLKRSGDFSLDEAFGVA